MSKGICKISSAQLKKFFTVCSWQETVRLCIRKKWKLFFVLIFTDFCWQFWIRSWWKSGYIINSRTRDYFALFKFYWRRERARWGHICHVHFLKKQRIFYIHKIKKCRLGIEIGDLWRVLKMQVSGLVLKRPRSAGRVSGFEKWYFSQK